MKRRRFLKIAIAFLGSITLLSFVYSLVKFLAALPSRIAEANRLIIRKSDIPSGEAKNFVYRNAPAVIINRPDKGFIALVPDLHSPGMPGRVPSRETTDDLSLSCRKLRSRRQRHVRAAAEIVNDHPLQNRRG